MKFPAPVERGDRSGRTGCVIRPQCGLRAQTDRPKKQPENEKIPHKYGSQASGFILGLSSLIRRSRAGSDRLQVTKPKAHSGQQKVKKRFFEQLLTAARGREV
jgi:hypothetical protein